MRRTVPYSRMASYILDPVSGRSVKELCAALDGVFLCR
jgi:hypothetical protein